MKEYKVPVQSLIDHIKTAIDVDDWAKEMAEDLLKRHIPNEVRLIKHGKLVLEDFGYCPSCGKIVVNSALEFTYFCRHCGQAVKWDV